MNLVPGCVTDSRVSITGTFAENTRNGHTRKSGFLDRVSQLVTRDDLNCKVCQVLPTQQKFAPMNLSFFENTTSCLTDLKAV